MLMQQIPSPTAVAVHGPDLSNMRLSHGYSCRVLCDLNRDHLFEVVDRHGEVYMAFLYRSCSPEVLNQLRDIFSTCWYPSNRFPMSRQEAIDSVPLATVESLPELDMWEAHTSMGEDLFWAKPDLLLEVTPMGKGCTIEIMCRGQNAFAYVRNRHCSSTDDLVTAQALAIRQMLHTKNQIKIQTHMGGMTASWYIPARKTVN